MISDMASQGSNCQALQFLFKAPVIPWVNIVAPAACLSMGMYEVSSLEGRKKAEVYS